MITRRQFQTRLASLAALGAVGATRLAHASAATPIDTARLLVGFPPGGSTDLVARRLAEKLRGIYVNNIIVENRPGAGTQIAVSALVGSPADGTTLLLSPPAPFSIFPHTYSKLPYSPDDVIPVSQVCAFSFAFAVGPAVPESITNIQEFLEWAKANPGKANFGSPASGSTPHLIGSILGQLGDVDLTHVAYRGDGPGLQDLMGGQVSGYSTVLSSYLPHLKSDRLRLLAVSGTERNPFVPDLATYQEQGYPLTMTEWFGIFLPAGASPELVERTARAVQEAVRQEDFGKGLADFGMTAVSSSPAELADRLSHERQTWGKQVEKIGFSADS